jgi:hypothetical protein
MGLDAGLFARTTVAKEFRMKYLLVACLLAATPTFADQWRCDADGGVCYTSRVINLPQDQGKLYTTIIGKPNDPHVQQLLRWFDQNPDLNRIKQSTHFHFLSSDSVMFKSRYDATTGDLPCLRIQQPDGTVVYQCSHKNLPLSAEALANSISTTCLRRNVQPDLHYHFHQVPDAPKPEPQPEKQPDIFTPGKPSKFEIPAWVFVTLGVVALVGGIAVKWAKELRGQR